MKILNIVEGYTDEGKEILESLGDVEYASVTQEELIEKVHDVDVLVVRIGLHVNKQVIDNAPNLKAIATATTGLNHIDVAYAKEKSIEVLSLKGEVEFLDTITSTAELAFSLLIDLMRLTPWAFEDVKMYNLNLEKFKGYSLYGKTLGIVGMGRLGKIIAAGAKGWRMNVIFCDPHVEQEAFPEYKKISFDELLKESDAISVHVHLSDETKDMFNAEVFKKMKNSAFMVNTSRGELVVEEDLIDALEQKEIAGYATDVLTNELGLLDDFSDHPYVEYAKKHQNMIIVPHTGGLTYDSRIGTDVFIAGKIKTFIDSQ